MNHEQNEMRGKFSKKCKLTLVAYVLANLFNSFIRVVHRQ